MPELLEDLQCFQTMLYLSYLVAIFVCCHGNGGLVETFSIYFLLSKTNSTVWVRIWDLNCNWQWTFRRWSDG